VIVVAENLTVTDSAVRRSVDEKTPQPILAIADQARRAGVRHLDINLGPRRKGSAEALNFVLNTLEGHWQGSLWIDTVDARLMELAAQTWRGQLVLNGYSGGGEREEVLEVAARYDCDLVVFLMSGGCVPAQTDERLALAAELLGRCGEAGIGPERILVDPLVAPLGWMDGQARNASLFEVLRELPGLFGPGIRSVVGLSNLVTRSTGQERVAWLEEVFLSAAWGAGLTHVMLDVGNATLLRTVRALEVFHGDRPFAPGDFTS
jgi:5-methyltetrahydrofolate corrinoid/iron sulfur protein methyltransferase